MKINEIFYSIQGEGPQVGMAAWFVRTSGCNLTCPWCDTKYASEGTEMTIEQIESKLDVNICRNIVITGGEPLIQNDFITFIKKLSYFNIYVESNGTIYNSIFPGYAKFIISPKLEFLTDNYIKVLKMWRYFATFKFVIGDILDFESTLKIIKQLKIEEKDIYFMPKGTNEKELKKNMNQIAEWIKKRASYARLSPRLHIHMYDGKRGV